MLKKIFIYLIVQAFAFLFVVLFLRADAIEHGYYTEAAEPEQTVEVVTETEKLEIPCDVDLTAKTYMDYRKITDRTSPQWEYIYSDAITVNDKGFLVTEDNYIGVALGSYFGEIGSKYNITLDSGIVLKVVKVEQKDDAHTCKHNVIAGSNDLIEFVIDTQAEYMQDNIWSNGYIYQGNFNNCPDFVGDIQKIERVTI